MTTYSPKKSDIDRTWHLIDADGLILGRMASEIAKLLRGKHKPTYSPHMGYGRPRHYCQCRQSGLKSR